jgi:hypothetical protein
VDDVEVGQPGVDNGAVCGCQEEQT